MGEIMITVFIGLWLSGAAVAAYWQLRKEYDGVQGGKNKK